MTDLGILGGGGGTQTYLQFYDEGVLIADTTDHTAKVDFVGAGVSAVFDSATKKITVTVPGAVSGSVPTGTGFRHVTSGTEDGAAKLVDTADVNNSAITLAKIANIAASRILGNNTGSPAAPIELTAAQTKALLAIAASDVSGLASVAYSGSASDIGSGTLAIGRIPTGTSSSTVCIGNDSRLSDSRAPSGTAGGDLAGTYPNPTIKDRATASKAANYTLTLTDGAIQVTATSTQTLPDATTCAGKQYIISNEGTAWSVVATIKSNGGTVDGAAAATGIKAFRGDSYLLMSDGTNWVVAQRPPKRRLIFQQLTQLSHTGDTTETTMVSATIPAGLLKAGSVIEAYVLYSSTNNTNAKTPRIRDGANNILSGPSIASTATYHQPHMWLVRDATTLIELAAGSGIQGGSSSTLTTFTIAALLTADQVWSFNLLNSGNSGDTSSIEYALLYVTDPA